MGQPMPDPAVYQPSICIVAQGAKEARIEEDVPLRPDALPRDRIARCRAARRSSRRASRPPYLSLALEIGTTDVRDLLIEMKIEMENDADETRLCCDDAPLRVSLVDARFLDAVIRFLEIVSDP
jgi:hypothetical protein